MTIPPRRRFRPAVLLAFALLAVPLLGLPPATDLTALAFADDGDGGDGGAGGGGGGGAGGDGGWEPDYDVVDTAPDGAPETFIANEILALDPSPAALRRATAAGATVIERIRAARLSLQVVRLRLPPGLDARTAREILSERDPRTFDLHHLYRLAQPAEAACSGDACAPLRLLKWPQDTRECGRGQSIGVVDTAVEARHPALAGAELRQRRFVGDDQQAATAEHGTAVAALLVGRPDSGFPGLLPRARLFAAAPFYALASGSATADAAGLVKSIDWLLSQGVQVIGMSLAGPGNRVLEAAVERAAAKGVVIAAAAGNGGRNAPPAYPAALERVLGVTAISTDGRIYWRANQGDYVDYALPGVNLWTADLGGGGKARSGTSFAVPFMVAFVSQSLAQRSAAPEAIFRGGAGEVVDLGAPGRDPVFGWGQPRFQGRCP